MSGTPLVPGGRWSRFDHKYWTRSIRFEATPTRRRGRPPARSIPPHTWADSYAGARSRNSPLFDPSERPRRKRTAIVCRERLVASCYGKWRGREVSPRARILLNPYQSTGVRATDTAALAEIIFVNCF